MSQWIMVGITGFSFRQGPLGPANEWGVTDLTLSLVKNDEQGKTTLRLVGLDGLFEDGRGQFHFSDNSEQEKLFVILGKLGLDLSGEERHFLIGKIAEKIGSLLTELVEEQRVFY